MRYRSQLARYTRLLCPADVANVALIRALGVTSLRSFAVVKIKFVGALIAGSGTGALLTVSALTGPVLKVLPVGRLSLLIARFGIVTPNTRRRTSRSRQ